MKNPGVSRRPISATKPIAARPITSRPGVKPIGSNPGLKRPGTGEPIATRPIQRPKAPITEVVERPIGGKPVVGKPIKPVDGGRRPGGNDSGEIVAGNGKVVDDYFVDIMEEGTFIHIGQPAPWDDPTDPFWQGEKPQDWKGYWPGQPAPGKNPPPVEVPDFDRPDIGDRVPPPTDRLPPPPPGYGDDIVFPDPIKRPCPPVCRPWIDITLPCLPPCRVSSCQTVCVDASLCVEVLADDRLKLVVGESYSLAAAGLGTDAGTVVLEVNGLGLPVKVLDWQTQSFDFTVPTLVLKEATPATLHVINNRGQLLASIEADLLPAE